MNRVVRDHITRQIDAGWRKRVAAAEKQASDLAEASAKREIEAFKTALATFRAAKEVTKKAEQALKAKGVTVQGQWDYYNEEPTYKSYASERRDTRATADAWRAQKQYEFEALELKLALTKDKLGVVEAFLATFGE